MRTDKEVVVNILKARVQDDMKQAVPMRIKEITEDGDDHWKARVYVGSHIYERSIHVDRILVHMPFVTEFSTNNFWTLEDVEEAIREEIRFILTKG